MPLFTPAILFLSFYLVATVVMLSEEPIMQFVLLNYHLKLDMIGTNGPDWYLASSWLWNLLAFTIIFL